MLCCTTCLKLFDSINQSILIKDLRKILENHETHLIKLLINVQVSVKCAKHKSDFFQTDTGVPQGDCASANEFTFYLAKAIQNNKNYEHDYMKTISIPTVPSHVTEHNYHQQTNNHIDINLELC